MIDIDTAKIEVYNDLKRMEIVAVASVMVGDTLYSAKDVESYRGLASDEYGARTPMNIAADRCVESIVHQLRMRFDDIIRKATT